MPDTKISALAIVGAAADAQDIPVNDAGTTKRITLGMVDSYILRAGHVATASLANNAVDNTKLRDSGACSIIGRATNAAGDPADISAAGNDTVLGRRANVLTFAQVATAEIANDAVDDTKAGNRVAQFYRRQGGDATDWDSPGANNYTPTAIRVQWGIASVTIANGANAGSTNITYPVAFSAHPFAMCCLYTTGFHALTAGGTASVVANCYPRAGLETTQLTLYLQLGTGTANGAYGGAVWWLAIGPE